MFKRVVKYAYRKITNRCTMCGTKKIVWKNFNVCIYHQLGDDEV
jgi:ribosomal protein S14